MNGMLYKDLDQIIGKILNNLKYYTLNFPQQVHLLMMKKVVIIP
jgi:hypothetical protein